MKKELIWGVISDKCGEWVWEIGGVSKNLGGILKAEVLGNGDLSNIRNCK
jgi:hypothetical protein